MSTTLDKLNDYHYYSEKFFQIQTKLKGLQPFVHREYQKRFYWFMQDIKGPKRIIVLKPRQAGFSTEVGGIFSHLMVSKPFYRGIAMADKKGRTEEIASIYRAFIEHMPNQLTPEIDSNNTEKLTFKKTKSGVTFETAHDPNAGRSGSRLFAHLSEVAFYRYHKEIDEGIQNSIPLSNNSIIIKESTANGQAGIGKPYYDLWNAAKSGDSIYKHFFVPWYEIDDYQIEPQYAFRATKTELDILRQVPSITEAHLAWRRLKVSEYLNDKDNQFLTPEERFKQDFPLTDREAFRSTGSPIFDPEKVTVLVERLTNYRPPNIKDSLKLDNHIIRMFYKELEIYAPPRSEKQYVIGADIAEGLAEGDSSSLFVMDENYNQVARWHGKIDPDMFGHLLIAIGDFYNTALLVPENNNMGHTTITTIKNECYPMLYKTKVEDKITKEFVTKYGWKTTSSSKMDMLNEFIKVFRDGDIGILDRELALEMTLLAREENGGVNLNGRDRVVAACLACMGRRHTIQVTEVKKDTRTKEQKNIDKVLKGISDSEKVDIF